MTLVVRHASERFLTRAEGRETWHSFSFGAHYDPANTGHGALVLHDEHRLAPGAGFATHEHRDVEVVTWVLRGALAHEDSTGRTGVVRPGAVQRMSAGTGVRHSERSADGPTDVVQAWVLPDGPAGPPEHAQRDVDLTGGGLVPVVSGLGHDGALGLRAPAALRVARLEPGEAVQLPEAPHLHVFVGRGEVDVEGAGRLGTGDAARGTRTGGQRVVATAPAELLVWELRR